jgi:hypothetical protein
MVFCQRPQDLAIMQQQAPPPLFPTGMPPPVQWTQAGPATSAPPPAGPTMNAGATASGVVGGGGQLGPNGDGASASVRSAQHMPAMAIGLNGQPQQHAVHVHIYSGETLSVRVGNEIQYITGRCTIFLQHLELLFY